MGRARLGYTGVVIKILDQIEEYINIQLDQSINTRNLK